MMPWPAVTNAPGQQPRAPQQQNAPTGGGMAPRDRTQERRAISQKTPTLVLILQNASGATAPLGTVAVINPANVVGTFSVSATLGDEKVIGVTLEQITANTSGRVAIGGYVEKVRTTGGVADEQYLRQSATLGVARATSAATGGSFGRALTGDVTIGGVTYVSALLMPGLGGAMDVLGTHEADVTTHGITAAAATVLDDATVAAMVDTLGGASSTGTDGLVRATSPTLVTPALGTPASGVMTNMTGLTATGHGSGYAGGHTDSTQKIWIPAYSLQPNSALAANDSSYDQIALLDGADDGFFCSGFLPFAPSAVKVICYTAVNSGDVAWYTTTSFAAVGESRTANTDSQGSAASPQVFTIVGGNLSAIDITGSFTGAAASDYFGLNFQRDGADALDTITTTLRIIGVLIEP